MTQEPSGWYADPTRRHAYRYWDGQDWTDQVSDGGTPGVDPIEVGAPTSNTPPAPGTKAPAPSQPTQQTAAQTSRSSGGTGFGVVLGLLIAIAVIVAIVVFVMNGGEDGGETSTTVAPVTTEAPVTTAP